MYWQGHQTPTQSSGGSTAKMGSCWVCSQAVCTKLTRQRTLGSPCSSAGVCVRRLGNQLSAKQETNAHPNSALFRWLVPELGTNLSTELGSPSPGTWALKQRRPVAVAINCSLWRLEFSIRCLDEVVDIGVPQPNCRKDRKWKSSIESTQTLRLEHHVI